MYNTNKELHIGFDIALQSINSSLKQVIKPEEKDWILNEVMYQLINNTVDPSLKISRNYFENDQKAIDILETLKVNNNDILPILTSKTKYGEAYSTLPKEYFTMIKARALLKPTESNIVSNGVINYYKVYFKDADNLDDYLSDFRLDISGNELFNINKEIEGEKQYNISALNSHETKYVLIRTALQVLNSYTGVSAYWTRFDNIYEPNHFIIFIDIQKFNDADEFNNISSSSLFTLVLGSYFKQFSPNTYSNYILDDDTYSISNCRIIKSDDEDLMNNHYYAKSVYQSPLITLGRNLIKVNVPDGYTVMGIIPEYYRRPKPIDHTLRQGCEILSDNFQNKLVNEAAQKVAARIKDDTYPNLINENILLE